jgi:hypothetical protein
MSFRLYDMTRSYLDLLDMATDPDSDDVDMESFVAAIDALESDINAKATNTACLIASLEAESMAVSQTIARMLKRAKSLDNRAQSLRDYLLNQLQLAGIKEARDERIQVKLRINPASVVVESPDRIPADYWRVTEKREPDKSLIKDALKAGAEIPGAWLRQTTRLEIK